MKHILIVSTDKFPNGNAGATRQQIIGKMFLELGYKVTHVGFGETTNFEMKELEKNFNYLSLRDNTKKRIINAFSYILFKHRLKKYLSTSKIEFSHILVVSVPLNALNYIKKITKNKSISLIHDSVEWYSPSEFKLGMFNFEYIKRDLMNKHIIDSQFKIISISNYLNIHFSNKGNKSIRIPFILDVNNSHFSKEVDKEKVVFLYAGMMGRKDSLFNFFEALSLLPETLKSKAEVRIFGPSLEELFRTKNLNSKVYESVKSQIKVFGRVPRKTVLENLKESDFTLLFRNANERYAKAGFPTKVVESLTYATPVFCNLSSDLDEYLYNNSNSILVDEVSTESINEAIVRALNLSYESRINMQKDARKCAEENFDYRNYLRILETLIENKKVE